MPPATEHRHADLSDRVVLYSSAFLSLFQFWGMSFFVLIVTIIPVGIALYYTLRAVAATAWIVTHFADWFIGAWLGLSLPMAVALAYLRWRRVHESRLVIDAAGFEHHWYPWRPVRVAWSDVKLVRDSHVPNRRAVRRRLTVETTRGRIELDADDWDVAALIADVERHVPITRATG